MNKLYIPIIFGTAREGAISRKVAEFVLREIKKKEEIETELIDVKDFGISRTGEGNKKIEEYRVKMEKMDGLIIISPEYNHGYPGELKLLLDSCYQEYNRKPVGICGVSAGPIGGARMAQVLGITLIELQMVPIREAVYFSKDFELFDEQGKIKDETYLERLNKFLDELIWYVKALKISRESKI